MAECFVDYRSASSVEHDVRALLAQRVYGLALGYEDLNDHDELRRDPLLSLAVGKTDPTGAARARDRDRGAALASSSTLNRLELGDPEQAAAHRYKRIAARPEALDDLLAELFVGAHAKPPREIWLDLDATDDPLHGTQEGRFFHGYYRCYCYLPLYVFCGGHLLCARLRPANEDPAAGAVAELARIVGRLRRAWPTTRIVVRGDSGFCRDAVMSWCEDHDLDYVFGLARNARLVDALGPALDAARAAHERTGGAARRYADFDYRTRKSRRRARRVVGKAEHLARGPNPRFAATSLPRREASAKRLYEKLYCARGDMENRIEEQQLDLFADRTSAHGMRANQLRLYFSSFAYVLLHGLRRLGARGTELARAQCGTLRLKLSRWRRGSASPRGACGCRSRRPTRTANCSPPSWPTCAANPRGIRPDDPATPVVANRQPSARRRGRSSPRRPRSPPYDPETGLRRTFGQPSRRANAHLPMPQWNRYPQNTPKHLPDSRQCARCSKSVSDPG